MAPDSSTASAPGAKSARFAAIAAAAALALLFVMWWAPELVVDDERFTRGTPEADAVLEEQRLNARHEARLAAAQAFAFLAVLVGALATWSTVRQTRAGQITDRFTAAVEHLGNSQVSVRVAAIHALGHISRDSPTNHPAIMAILGDHLRARHPASPGQDESLPAPHPEVRAAALVLRRRRVEHDIDDAPLDLSGIDLRAAPLKGVRLARAILTDSNLRRADFRGADLTGAELVRARLNSAYLQEAIFDEADLTGARLTAAHARATSFRAADLNAAVYGVRRGELVQGRTDVSGADFSHADAPTLDAVSVSWQEDLPPRWPGSQ